MIKRFLTNLGIITTTALVFTGVFWYYFATDAREDSYSVSPLPDFLTLSKNKQVRLLDLWFPAIEQTHGNGFNVSELTAKSAVIYDLTTNKTIFEKNPKEHLPMASLTKIMTAIISLENKKSEDTYIVSEENLVGEDSMGLSAGESLTLEDLLYGLMLPSGNDAAEVLANNSPLGRKGFIQAMNDKAKSLGLTDTHFDNPSGLQGDGTQYTTVYDLLVITKYAMEKYPLFKEVVSSPTHTIPETSTHKAYFLGNETNLLTTYEGVKGVKTGYTPEAGLCLVTYIEYANHKMIGIILNSENRRGEMKELLDYSLRTFGIEPPIYKG